MENQRAKKEIFTKIFVEKYHADVNAKGKYRNFNNDGGHSDEYEGTPLFIAVKEGKIDVVKYFVEECHADIESKVRWIERGEYHPSIEMEGSILFYALSDHINRETIEYLVEKCHPNSVKGTIRYENGKIEEVTYTFTYA